MNRTAWLAALALVLVPGATFAQMGGMGGMGGGMGGMGGGMGGGVRGMGGMGRRMGIVMDGESGEIRRAVQVEMEGGRRLSGQIDLGTLMVYGDLGQFAIQPDKVKMIRFLKPANVPKPDDDEGDAQPPVPAPAPGGGNNAQAMVMMMRRANQNNAMNMPPVRAKVILNSGEEIVGNIQNAVGFRLDVDYGSMIPAIDKLRTMTFSDVDRKAASTGPEAAKPDEGPPRAAGDLRDPSSAAPQYYRYQNTLIVRSHAGDRIVLYNLESKESQELSGPKDGPLQVAPIQSQDLMALTLGGPKITRIAVADTATGWHVQDLRQPVEGRVMPTVAQGVAVYSVGRYVYAYGAGAHRWDVAELPEGLRAAPIVGPNTATIEGGGHVYTFAANTGKWEHVDVRAILDVAGAERK